MSTLATFTFPGRLGDALLQWPVAFQYATQRNEQIAVWLDQGTLAPLAPLLAAQPCVAKVELHYGITNYGCGGQPFDFGGQSAHVGSTFHLGMRQQPTYQITLETLNHYPQFDLDPARLAEPSLLAPCAPTNRCVVHPTLHTHLSTGMPDVWSFLDSICDDLNAMFAEVVIVGKPQEVAAAHAQFPEWTPLYDHGNLATVATLMAGSRLVIGAGSSMVTLAGNLGIPWIRIHDPAGNHRSVFGSLGPAHTLNESFADALTEWPSFRDALPVWEG